MKKAPPPKKKFKSAHRASRPIKAIKRIKPTRPIKPVRPVKPVKAAKIFKPVKPAAKPAVPAGVPAALVRQAIEAGSGILRLAPTWVPRSFLMPGKRIKLAPQDIYALGAHRGGIDERWFSSTTPAANEGAPPDEGLSYVLHGERPAGTLAEALDNRGAFTLKDAVELEGARLVGGPIWDKYKRSPVYS